MGWALQRPLLLLLLLLLLQSACVLGGGNQGSSQPGYSTSTSCTATSQCSSSAANYISRSLTYAPATGLFSGTITANGCPETITTFALGTPTCFTQTFPGYTTRPAAAPLTGALGYSLSGENIYNPLEAGFSSSSGPTVCSNSSYFCSAGSDIGTCLSELQWTCGTGGAASYQASISTSSTIFGDRCGGHANPYHFHEDLQCSYSPNSKQATASVTAHSPLIGIALDGYGIYGVWESAGTAPTLDACNGHVGPIPGTASTNRTGTTTSLSGITGLASGQSVYHYHLSATFPYTLGCFGPADLATCRALYSSSCNTWAPRYYGNGSAYYYDDWCPCGNNGQKPATPIYTVPTVSGATCSTTFTGTTNGLVTPQVACDVAYLRATASSPSTSTPPSQNGPPQSGPPGQGNAPPQGAGPPFAGPPGQGNAPPQGAGPPFAGPPGQGIAPPQGAGPPFAGPPGQGIAPPQGNAPPQGAGPPFAGPPRPGPPQQAGGPQQQAGGPPPLAGGPPQNGPPGAANLPPRPADSANQPPVAAPPRVPQPPPIVRVQQQMVVAVRNASAFDPRAAADAVRQQILGNLTGSGSVPPNQQGPPSNSSGGAQSPPAPASSSVSEVAVYVDDLPVRSTLSLQLATFSWGSNATTQLANSIATAVGVSPTRVSVTSITPSSRRRLLATYTADFNITGNGNSTDAVSSIQSAISASTFTTHLAATVQNITGTTATVSASSPTITAVFRVEAVTLAASTGATTQSLSTAATQAMTDTVGTVQTISTAQTLAPPPLPGINPSAYKNDGPTTGRISWTATAVTVAVLAHALAH